MRSFISLSLPNGPSAPQSRGTTASMQRCQTIQLFNEQTFCSRQSQSLFGPAEPTKETETFERRWANLTTPPTSITQASLRQLHGRSVGMYLIGHQISQKKKDSQLSSAYEIQTLFPIPKVVSSSK